MQTLIYKFWVDSQGASPEMICVDMGEPGLIWDQVLYLYNNMCISIYVYFYIYIYIYIRMCVCVYICID